MSVFCDILRSYCTPIPTDIKEGVCSQCLVPRRARDSWNINHIPAADIIEKKSIFNRRKIAYYEPTGIRIVSVNHGRLIQPTFEGK